MSVIISDSAVSTLPSKRPPSKISSCALKSSRYSVSASFAAEKSTSPTVKPPAIISAAHSGRMILNLSASNKNRAAEKSLVSSVLSRSNSSVITSALVTGTRSSSSLLSMSSKLISTERNPVERKTSFAIAEIAASLAAFSSSRDAPRSLNSVSPVSSASIFSDNALSTMFAANSIKESGLSAPPIHSIESSAGKLSERMSNTSTTAVENVLLKR